MKREYRVPLVWKRYGHVWVMAEDEETAIQLALANRDKEPEGEYLVGSVQVDGRVPVGVSIFTEELYEKLGYAGFKDEEETEPMLEYEEEEEEEE